MKCWIVQDEVTSMKNCPVRRQFGLWSDQLLLPSAQRGGHSEWRSPLWYFLKLLCKGEPGWSARDLRGGQRRVEKPSRKVQRWQRGAVRQVGFCIFTSLSLGRLSQKQIIQCLRMFLITWQGACTSKDQLDPALHSHHWRLHRCRRLHRHHHSLLPLLKVSFWNQL